MLEGVGIDVFSVHLEANPGLNRNSAVGDQRDVLHLMDILLCPIQDVGKVLQSRPENSHVVPALDSPEPPDKIGKMLRYHKYYQPQGTNVNFAQLLSDKDVIKIKIRTYERGVEAETLSCGSGAAAAALSFIAEAGYRSGEVQVVTKGGNLYITIHQDQKKIFLEGPVEIVYQGKYLKEDDS